MNNIFRLYYINQLNDYIIENIPKDEISVIRIIDVENFLILKGHTTLSTPLDIFSITTEFRKKFEIPEEIKLNTIDLIEYSLSDEECYLKDIPILTSIKYNLNNT